MGTVHDPFWMQPALPAYYRRTLPTGGSTITSLGFGDPVPAPSYTPALRRQVALLTSDEEADYSFFDKEGRPVRFLVPDNLTKFTFRLMRTGVFASEERLELAPFAQYLIAMMSARPGFSKEMILAQLVSEYDTDVRGRVESFAKSIVKNPRYRRTTYLEACAKNIGEIPLSEVGM
jgi:hypothetical protein